MILILRLLPSIQLIRLGGGILIASIALGISGCSPKPDASISSPAELWQSVRDVPREKVWLHPSGAASLRADGFEIPAPDAASFAAASSPDVWRHLHRERGFDAVVLAGSWSEIAPLAKHLRESGDFAPVRVDPWGVVFLRNQPDGWDPPSVESVIARLNDPLLSASWLSGTALILQVLGEGRVAQEYLTAASRLAPEDDLVAARVAAVDLMRDRLAEAVATADQVLARDPKHVVALQIKSQALYKAGAHEEAWEVAERLIGAANPDDMVSLLLHARVSNAARAFQSEKASLERLVERAEKANVPVSNYRVLLGQCYARLGLGRQAMEQLLRVQSDPALSEADRESVETAIESLKRSGF